MSAHADDAHRGGAPAAPSRRTLGFVEAFDEFYAEVLLQKRRVSLSASPPSPEVVKQRLVDVFQAQAGTLIRGYAEHEIAAFEEAQYIMAAMADEVFLHLDWSGRLPWASKPLESELFHTHDSGERFFRRLDELLSGRAAGSSELLTVYLTALALGFRGRFAFEDPTRPEAYRRKLAAHLSRVDPERVSLEKELCPEALTHTLSSQKPRRLPAWSRGILPIVLVVTGWIFIAEIFWYYRTTRVTDALDRIEGSE